MAYYLDPNYEQSYYPNSPAADDHGLGSSLHYDNYSSIPTSHSLHPSSSTSSHDAHPSYPPYETDSPYHSPGVSAKAMTLDGRLKTKLMGIGSDGGFLTSPLVVGKSRMAPLGGDIQIASPALSELGNSESYGGDSGPIHHQTGMDMEGGMGIGITGVSELSGGLEMGDYGNANLKIFGMPKSGRTSSDCGFLPYPEHLPTTTLGRGKNNVIEVAALLPPPLDKYVDQRFRSPPPQARPLVAPATARKMTNPKNLTVKTLNKAKSCSALNKQPTSSFEPLTPVSSHGPNFFNIPGVPFNSPVDDNPQPIPLTFADLYNFGLAIDSVDEIDARKGPMPYPQDLQSPVHMLSYGGDDEFGSLHNLPTPYLAHGSGFSSPSTSYLSDPSPELAQMSIPNRSPGQLSSASMLSAPSMEQQYSLPFSNALPPNSPSRQPCASYATRGPVEGGMLDPSALAGAGGMGLSPSMQRHTSNPGYQGAPRYAYPTRFSSDQGQVQVGPYGNQAWSNEQVVATYATSPQDLLQQNLFQPPTTAAPYDAMGRNLDKYEANLEAFEDMYERYSQASTGHSTPGKRGRGTDDEFDYEDDGEYIPGRGQGGGGSPSSATPRKRLRTVASAPILGSPRRMRPGPKPKVTKSPQEACQSVFSANLSPPPIQFRRGSSPFAYGSPGAISDDEDGSGMSSIPKETIQSLYEGVAGHTTSNGQKIPKRYVCLIEGCERTFPRKSAIESHIQTHLEDKPFVCTQPDWCVLFLAFFYVAPANFVTPPATPPSCVSTTCDVTSGFTLETSRSPVPG